MKKLFTLACLCLLTTAAMAQITNPGMEAPWRTNTTGTGSTFHVSAPYGWFGLDSLVIADGETYGPLIGAGNNYHQQIFKDSLNIHGGTYSAKIVTQKQDTLGEFSGILSNAQTSIDVLSLLGGGGSLQSATSYTGGTYVTERITHVLAWVQYYTPGTDSGMLQVLATKNIGGYDSVVGSGNVIINSSNSNASGFSQIQASVFYTDPNIVPDTIRIFFLSSAGGEGGVDSSVLYVDDVTMDTINNLAVPNTMKQNDVVTIYPNPTTGTIHLLNTTNEVLTWRAFAVNGQQVSESSLTGNDNVDLSSLPDGIYFYDLADKSGVIVQRGKVSVVK